MKAWHKLLAAVMSGGEDRPDRTGVGTRALFGIQVAFDNRTGTFPAVTTKRLFFGQVKAELACFINGYQSLDAFNAMGCTIWDGNGKADYWTPRARYQGDLGRIYGVQWRDWLSVPVDQDAAPKRTDQLAQLVEGLLRDPYGRRHVVTAWNPGELDQMCLPPCHVLFQCFVGHDGRLDMRVDMRSVDLFLGLPFDIASYALLQKLIAAETGLGSGWLVFQLGDAHIYKNHFEQVNTVLQRTPFAPPILELISPRLFSFLPEQASLERYVSHNAVPAPLNV